MKIYIVTSGEYSGYGIDAVFTDEEHAWKYASLDDDRRIEEYDADTENVDGKLPSYITIVFDFNNHCIYSMRIEHAKITDRIEVDRHPCLFKFQAENTLKNYKEFLRHRDGKISWPLRKVADDRFSMYLDSVGMSRQEAIDKSMKECKAFADEMDIKYKRTAYVHYTTASIF